MASRYYRNYYSWILAAEPRLGIQSMPVRDVRRVVALAMVVFFFAAFLLWQRMQVVKMGYDVVELGRQRDVLLIDNARLRRGMRQLHSLAHVESVARQKLGMKNLDARRVVYIGDPFSNPPGMLRKSWEHLRRWW